MGMTYSWCYSILMRPSAGESHQPIKWPNIEVTWLHQIAQQRSELCEMKLVTQSYLAYGFSISGLQLDSDTLLVGWQHSSEQNLSALQFGSLKIKIHSHRMDSNNPTSWDLWPGRIGSGEGLIRDGL